MNKIHPIDPTIHQYIQVFWQHHWHMCEYTGWEPVLQNDLWNSRKAKKGYILYSAIPFNINSGLPCSEWQHIHESRVLPFLGIPSLEEKKKPRKRPYKW